MPKLDSEYQEVLDLYRRSLQRTGREGDKRIAGVAAYRGESVSGALRKAEEERQSLESEALQKFILAQKARGEQVSDVKSQREFQRQMTTEEAIRSEQSQRAAEERQFSKQKELLEMQRRWKGEDEKKAKKEELYNFLGSLATGAVTGAILGPTAFGLGRLASAGLGAVVGPKTTAYLGAMRAVSPVKQAGGEVDLGTDYLPNYRGDTSSFDIDATGQRYYYRNPSYNWKNYAYDPEKMRSAYYTSQDIYDPKYNPTGR